MKHTLRIVSALVPLLGATLLHYIGEPFYLTLILWFLLAISLGFLLPHWRAILLAVIPWPFGVGLGLVTGRYLFLGEAWQGMAMVSFLVGTAGVAVGVSMAKLL